MTSLEGWSSTIELHPQVPSPSRASVRDRPRSRGDRTRTCDLLLPRRRASHYATPRPSGKQFRGRTPPPSVRHPGQATNRSAPERLNRVERFCHPSTARRIAGARSARILGRFCCPRLEHRVVSVPSTVEQLSPTRVKITVEVPFADLKPSMDKAYAEIAKTVNIPGFRRGQFRRWSSTSVSAEASCCRSTQQLPGRLLPLGDHREQTVAARAARARSDQAGGRGSDQFTAEVDIRPDFDLPDFAKPQGVCRCTQCPRVAGRRSD